MNPTIRNIYILFIITIILLVASFFILISKINDINNSLGNKTLDQKKSEPISLVNNNTNEGSNTNNNTSSSKTTGEENTKITSEPQSITTNILFNISPENETSTEKKLTVLINKVSKDAVGYLNVSVKVFTDNFSTYSSLKAEDMIQIFNQSGENIRANKIIGAFKRMPPQSSVDGILTFIINPDLESLILQIGSPEEPSFYEFNFKTQTYKEVILG